MVSANEAVKRDWSISSTAHQFSPAYIYNQINVGVDDYVLGDLNGDGEITAIDARNVLKIAGGETTPSAMEFVIADVNGDARVTAIDSRYILQYAGGVITKLPIYN